MSISRPLDSGPPSRQALRTIIAAQDLCVELDRWSAYAHAAQDEAFGRTRQADEAVAVAVREAAFLTDLCQRTDASLFTVRERLVEAEDFTQSTEQQLRLRHDSWEHSRQIADHAVLSWTAALEHASQELAAAETRLSQAVRKLERLSRRPDGVMVVVAAGDAGVDRHGRSGRRRRLRPSSSGRDRASASAGRLVAEAELAVARSREVETAAQARVGRLSAALEMAQRAERLVDRSLQELGESLQSAGLAIDYVTSARAAVERAIILTRAQSNVAGDVRLESAKAVRAIESSVRIVGVVYATYEDARLTLFDARLEMDDRIESMQSELAHATRGMA